MTDLQLLLIAVVIIVVIVILITCFLFGAREREFDDVYAKEKGIRSLLDEKSTATNKQTKGKATKTKVKFVKHKETKSEQPKVIEEEEKPLTSEHEEPSTSQSEEQPLHEEPKRKSKKQKRHVQEVEVEPVVVAEEQEERSHTPPDEHPQDPDVPVVEEEIVIPVQEATSKKNKKKKKVGQTPSDTEKIEKVTVTQLGTAPTTYAEPDVEVLIEQLKRTDLSEVYLSSIVECLLMKQEFVSQNAKNAEEISKLKRELENKNKTLIQETQLVQSANMNIKEFKQQLENESNKSAALEKTYRDQLAQKQTEIQNLTRRIHVMLQEAARMQETLRQANPSIVEQLRQELQQMKDRCGRVESEQHQRQEQLQHYQTDLVNKDQQLRLADQNRQKGDKHVHDVQMEIDKLKKTNSTLTGQMNDLQTQIAAKENELSKTRVEFNGLKDEYTGLDEAVNVLRKTYEKSQSALLEANAQLEQNDTDGHYQMNGDVQSEQLQIATERKAELEKLVSDLKSRVESMEKEVKNSERNLSEQKSDFDKQTTTLKAQIDALQTEKNAITQKGSKSEESRSKEMENLLNAKNKLESQVNDMKLQLTSSDRIAHDLDNKIADFMAKLDAANARTTALQLTEKTLIEECAMQSEAKKAADEEIANLRANLKNATEQLDNFASAEIAKLKNELLEANERLKQKDTPIDHKTDGSDAVLKLQKDLTVRDKEIQKLKYQLTVKNVEPVLVPETVSELGSASSSKELQEAKTQLGRLQHDLEEQRKKNNELREKNYKVVDNVQQLEKTSKQLLDQTEKKYEKQLKEQHKATQDAMKRLFPGTKIPPAEPETYREWLHEIETIIKQQTVHTHTHTHSMEEKIIHKPNSMDSKLRSENENLKAEVAKFKDLLSQVDSDLYRLEENATKEQKNWQQRCLELEKALVKAKTDGSESVKQLKSTEEIVTHLSEVRAHLSELQMKLKTEEKERDMLREQVIIIQKELETERITGRDLSAQAVKLRGMLKTGQDALQQEQQLVNELKTQLKQYQEETGEYSLLTEMEQLKVRLQNREHQLEKEMSVNKQLSNKLSSLGVQIHDSS